MVSTATQMAQLNLRIDAREKRQAEEVLHLMGTTATELVRALYAKVARGAKDYAEVAEVLETSKVVADEQASEQGVNPILLEGWARVDEFICSLGYANVDDVPMDTRSWEERYEEAMLEKAREKGWVS